MNSSLDALTNDCRSAAQNSTVSIGGVCDPLQKKSTFWLSVIVLLNQITSSVNVRQILQESFKKGWIFDSTGSKVFLFPEAIQIATKTIRKVDRLSESKDQHRCASRQN
jgi:hypothetical protein